MHTHKTIPEEQKRAHANTVALARRWHWPHGSETVLVQEANVGLVDQWTTGWAPRSDNDVYLVLEDDVQVSYYFYRWIKPAIMNYGVQEHHPHLFGFGLQRVHMCVGETARQRWGTLNHQALLGDRRAFLFQQVGPWAPVVFARP